MPVFRKPILDTKTDNQYTSEYQTGKALRRLVGDDVKSRHTFYKLAKKFPGRFLTKDRDGNWADLNDPNVPKGTMRH